MKNLNCTAVPYKQITDIIPLHSLPLSTPNPLTPHCGP